MFEIVLISTQVWSVNNVKKSQFFHNMTPLPPLPQLFHTNRLLSILLKYSALENEAKLSRQQWVIWLISAQAQ